MRLEIREFRIPIVLTALMIGVISYWTWQTWHWLDDHEIDRARHDAYRNSDMLISARFCRIESPIDFGNHP